jgi:KamA family protein
MPVVIPSRMTPTLVSMLAATRLQASLVIHANHAQELDDGVMKALAPLRHAGITLLNQAVLLAGINDDADAQVALSERLFAIGVLPYYVHLLDHVAGATHFDAAEALVQSLRESLLARLPGYLVPQFVREVPQAASKVPVFPA